MLFKLFLLYTHVIECIEVKHILHTVVYQFQLLIITSFVIPSYDLYLYWSIYDIL